MCELNDTELASYKTGASVWGKARGYWGQYNLCGEQRGVTAGGITCVGNSEGLLRAV